MTLSLWWTRSTLAATMFIKHQVWSHHSQTYLQQNNWKHETDVVVSLPARDLPLAGSSHKYSTIFQWSRQPVWCSSRPPSWSRNHEPPATVKTRLTLPLCLSSSHPILTLCISSLRTVCSLIALLYSSLGNGEGSKTNGAKCRASLSNLDFCLMQIPGEIINFLISAWDISHHASNSNPSLSPPDHPASPEGLELVDRAPCFTTTELVTELNCRG